MQSAALWAVALAAAAQQFPPAFALEPPSCAERAVTVRAFVDLQCPHSRRLWPVLVEAVAAQPCATLVVQQLPVSAHQQALPLAQAALAARKAGKELAFAAAVYALPDSAAADAVAKAAAAAGLDPANLAAEAAKMAASAEAERQSAVAFGVTATPSLLLNGKGLSGVPTVPVLAKALQEAARFAGQCAKTFGTCSDPERARIAQGDPDFLDALDQMRQTRNSAAATGEWGKRYRVTTATGDIAVGPDRGAAAAVLFVDPRVPWMWRDAAQLLAIQKANPALRVALLFAASGGNTGPAWAMAGQWQALWAASPVGFRQLLADAALQKAPTPAAMAEKIAQLDPAQAAMIATAAASGDVAALHSRHADLIRRVDAAAGALFVDGVRWLGRAGDRGFAEGLQDAIAKRAKQSAHIDADIAAGQWRSDADLDLGLPQSLGNLAALPKIGVRGPQVVFAFDPASPAARAAWYMLRRFVPKGGSAIQLFLAPNPRAAQMPAVAAAVLAAGAKNKADVALDAIFAAAKADDKSLADALAKACGLDKPAWQALVASPETQKAWKSGRDLADGGDLGELPAIVIDGRLYAGPLDEARLTRALFGQFGGGAK